MSDEMVFGQDAIEFLEGKVESMDRGVVGTDVGDVEQYGSDVRGL